MRNYFKQIYQYFTIKQAIKEQDLENFNEKPVFQTEKTDEEGIVGNAGQNSEKVKSVRSNRIKPNKIKKPILEAESSEDEDEIPTYSEKSSKMTIKDIQK